MPDSTPSAPAEHDKRSLIWLGIVVAYVIIVLAVDTLAVQRVQWPFPWSRLQWHLGTTFPGLRETPWGAFDLYKFVFWFLIPFAVSLPRMEWRYLVGKWDRWDALLVGGLTVLGMAAMFLIPLVPALQATYRSLDHLTPEQKWSYVQRIMVWNVSWLFGWEFLHRYVLLRAAQRAPLTGRWGFPAPKLTQYYWLLVPLSETVYHLQKPLVEAGGMLAFSLVLTLWCLVRKKWLVACLVHLIIEVELAVFMTLLG